MNSILDRIAINSDYLISNLKKEKKEIEKTEQKKTLKSVLVFFIREINLKGRDNFQAI